MVTKHKCKFNLKVHDNYTKNKPDVLLAFNMLMIHFKHTPCKFALRNVIRYIVYSFIKVMKFCKTIFEIVQSDNGSLNCGHTNRPYNIIGRT